MKNEMVILELVENALHNLKEMPKLNPSVFSIPTFSLIKIQLEKAVELLEDE